MQRKVFNIKVFPQYVISFEWQYASFKGGHEVRITAASEHLCNKDIQHTRDIRRYVLELKHEAWVNMS